MTGPRTWRRGVSDILGFAVVFGVVVLSISLVYTFGVGALSDVQQAEATDNAGRAFDIVADNMADVHRDGAPGRSTELDFKGGELAVSGQVTFTVTNESRNVSESFVATPIRYTTNDQGFYYVSGAVVRRSGDGAILVNDPPFRFGDERTVISVVETKPTDDADPISGGTVRLAGRNGGSSVAAIETGGVTFNVSVTSPRYPAWQRYFERKGLNCLEVDAVNDTVVCQSQTETLYVRRTVIRVSLTP